MEQDKEMIEKIAKGLPKNPCPNQYITDFGQTTYQIDKEVEAGRIAYMEAQRDMIKAGYRKVDPEKIAHLEERIKELEETVKWLKWLAQQPKPTRTGYRV